MVKQYFRYTLGARRRPRTGPMIREVAGGFPELAISL